MKTRLKKNIYKAINVVLVKLFPAVFLQNYNINCKKRIILISLLVLLNCQKSKTYELTINPEILFEKNLNISELSLRGIKLDQDASQIDPNLIKETQDGYGWVLLKESSSIRVVGKKVVSFRLGKDIYSKLNIHTIKELEEKFGIAESRDDHGGAVDFSYDSKKIFIEWCEFPEGHSICGIIVGYLED
jgi:hypothetical protein